MDKIIYATLSWKLADYKKNSQLPPERIKSNPQKTEGEMMSDEEIEFWFADSLKVLQVLKEEYTRVFKKIYKGFLMDLEYLLSLGKIKEDVLEYVLYEENFDFDKEDK